MVEQMFFNSLDHPRYFKHLILDFVSLGLNSFNSISNNSCTNSATGMYFELIPEEGSLACQNLIVLVLIALAIRLDILLATAISLES